MALKKNVQTIGFSASIKESVDPLLVPNGALRSILNGVFDVDGRIRKRKGFVEMTSDTVSGQPLYASVAMGEPSRLFRRKDELCAFDDTRVFGYTPHQTKWALKSELGSFMAERVGFYKDIGYSVQEADCAVTSDGLLCVAYAMIDRATESQPGGADRFLYSSIYDLSTGGVVMLHKRIDGVSECRNPRVIIQDDGSTEYFVVVYEKTTPITDDNPVSTKTLLSTYLDSADVSATWSVPVVIATIEEHQFDAVSLSGAVYAVAYYATGEGGDILEVDLHAYNTAGTPAATYTVACSLAGALGIALDWDGDPSNPSINDRVHVAYYDNVSVRWKSLTSVMALDQSATVETTIAITGVFPFRIGVKAVPGESKALVTWTEIDTSGVTLATTYLMIMKARWLNPTSGTLYGSAEVITAHQAPTSRPFLDNGMVCMQSCGDTWYHLTLGAFEGIYLLRFDPALAEEQQLAPRVVSQMALGEGLGMANVTNFLRQVTSYDGKYYMMQALATSDTSGGGLPLGKFHWETFRLDPSSYSRAQPLYVAENTLLLGGVPSQYDGDIVSELSFPYAPVIAELEEASGGAILKAGSGIFYYKVTFEWFNNDGQRVYSATSRELDITLSASNKKIEVRFRGIHVTSKSDWFPSATTQVFACIYRTLEDDDDVYYLAGRLQMNRWAVDYYEFIDNIPDATLADAEQLYTNGIELDATPLPSCSVGTVVDGRVWARSDENKYVLYYSKPLTPTRPVEFNYEFSFITVPFRVYGMAAQSGACIAIGAESVNIIEGRGPGKTGQGESFQQRTIISGVGTTQPLSVVETPQGTLFFDGQTWCLINGKFGLEILGDIDVTMALYPTIADREFVDADSTIRFLCVGDDDYRVITFDWKTRNFSIHEPTFMSGPLTEVIPTCIAQVAGEVYMGAGPAVYQESGYSDIGIVPGNDLAVGSVRFYPLSIETADLKTGNLSDFKRVWRCILLLRRMDVHGIRLWAAYNGSPVMELVHEWTATDITARGVLERLRHHMKRQKCSTIRYKIEDTDPGTGYGTQGYEALGLTLELGMKDGTLKFQKESA